jgi:cytochrome c oxidase subunit 2
MRIMENARRVGHPGGESADKAERMKKLNTGMIGAFVAALAVFACAGAAAAGVGQPVTGQIGLQGSVTPVMDEITSFYGLVNTIIIAIAIFVLILMVFVMVRFNRKSNPDPSKTTHNTMVEVVWTVVPVLILVFIGIYSFRLLFLQYEYPKPDLTIKAIGNAWYWEHVYKDHDDMSVVSNMLTDTDMLKRKLGDDEFEKKYGSLDGTARSNTLYRDAKPLWQEAKLLRQLSVDNEIAVPVNAVVHVLVTSNDVIHGWAMPSFGSRVQAVPGRTTATWFKARKTGIYYGQCAVLCGLKHSAMPIAVRVVDQDVFDKWMAAVKEDKLDEARKILTAAGEQDGATNKIASASQAR